MINNPDNQKSFKPLRKIEKGSRGYGLKQIAQMTLGSGNILKAVQLPTGEELNEWLAVNTIEFFNDVSVIYGAITEFCTRESCPTMTAGPKYEYLWADGQNIKQPLKVSAAEYIDFLMTWVENQLDNPNLMPIDVGIKFPKNFHSHGGSSHYSGYPKQNLYGKSLSPVLPIYHSHFQHVMSLGIEFHLNTCFKHFLYFMDEFELVEDKELAPLSELISEFRGRKSE